MPTVRQLADRLNALEQRGSARVRFAAKHREDGSLVPLAPGERYARSVALLPEPCSSTEEWLKRYVPRVGGKSAGELIAAIDTVQRRAMAELAATSAEQTLNERRD